MKRLRVFVKGNVDVHDSLHSCRLGRDLLWNGINTAFREQAIDITARVRHETWTRSDALLAASGDVPDLIAARGLALGVHPPAIQFSRAVFDAPSDVVVLSIQPDIMSSLLRHRQTGVLLYPDGVAQWPADDRAWVTSEFERIEPLDVAQSMGKLRAIVAGLRRDRAIPILIYNASSVVPGETMHNFEGLEETLSERIKRFNLGLTALSRETGISVIDVDRIVAQHGADTLKHDPIHLTAAGYRLLAHEVVRVLEDVGALE